MTAIARVSPTTNVTPAKTKPRSQLNACCLRGSMPRGERRMNQDRQSLEAFMREAIAQGKLALPACLPNPPVGCVLVRDGAIIARGFTQPPYQPHAEPITLSQVGGYLDDVTAFVTLEPCAF